jgi:hypothetical protein
MMVKGVDISKYRFSKMLLHSKDTVDYIGDDTVNGDIEKFIERICKKQD